MDRSCECHVIVCRCNVVLCLHTYSPNFEELSPSNAVENNQLAFSIAEEQFGITSLLKPTEMENPDKLGLFTYLSLFYEFLFNKEPAVISGTSNKAKKSTPVKTTLQRRKSRMKFLATSPPSAERSWNTKSIRRDFSSPPCSPTEPTSQTFVPIKKVRKKLIMCEERCYTIVYIAPIVRVACI